MALPLIFVLALGGGFLFPWWWPALAAYGVGIWLGRKGSWAFLSGFAGTALAWGVLAAFMDWRNHQLLSRKMAALFHLPSPFLLLAITAVIGGLLGGLGAWAGQALGAWFTARRQPSGADIG